MGQATDEDFAQLCIYLVPVGALVLPKLVNRGKLLFIHGQLLIGKSLVLHLLVLINSLVMLDLFRWRLLCL